MTTEGKIIRDLRSGRSSVNALSMRIKVPERSCQVVLDRLVSENRITPKKLDCGIVVYELGGSFLQQPSQ